MNVSIGNYEYGSQVEKKEYVPLKIFLVIPTCKLRIADLPNMK